MLLHVVEYKPTIWNVFSKYRKLLIPIFSVIIGLLIASVSSKSATFIYFQF